MNKSNYSFLPLIIIAIAVTAVKNCGEQSSLPVHYMEKPRVQRYGPVNVDLHRCSIPDFSVHNTLKLSELSNINLEDLEIRDYSSLLDSSLLMSRANLLYLAPSDSLRKLIFHSRDSLLREYERNYEYNTLIEQTQSDDDATEEAPPADVEIQ